MAKFMVDPSPEGWKYGFPALWDTEEYKTVEELLDAHEYPKDMQEYGVLRMWKPDEEVNE